MREQPSGGAALSEAAKAYIEAHSAEKFSLDAMAKSLFVNSSYLLRTFKRHVGVTPLAYHHWARCVRARELLAHSSLSISKVGEQVGFVSSSHFSHIFKKAVGCTPREYRAQLQTDSEEASEP